MKKNEMRAKGLRRNEGPVPPPREPEISKKNRASFDYIFEPLKERPDLDPLPNPTLPDPLVASDIVHWRNQQNQDVLKAAQAIADHASDYRVDELLRKLELALQSEANRFEASAPPQRGQSVNPRILAARRAFHAIALALRNGRQSLRPRPVKTIWNDREVLAGSDYVYISRPNPTAPQPLKETWVDPPHQEDWPTAPTFSSSISEKADLTEDILRRALEQP